MARDRTDSGMPLLEMPEVTGAVHPVPARMPTLGTDLVTTVDDLRQLYTDFGLRPYRVFLVHVAWSGGRRGDGNPIELSRREILPTPRVLDMGSTSFALRSIGLTEEGGVVIEHVSPKYTEDDLLGRTPDLIDPAFPATGLANVEFFWEVAENRPSNPEPVRRRYVPSSTPMLTRDIFQWRVGLVKQDLNRDRRGGFDKRMV
jgi:hypothetical protein